MDKHHIFSPIFLIHYHEIGLKGRNRSSFERQLIRNIEFSCESLPIKEIIKISGRILVCVDNSSPAIIDDGSASEGLSSAPIKKLFNTLRKIPGVARVSVGWRTSRELDDIFRLASEVLLDSEPFESFKVEAKRSNTDFPIDSMELNRIVGAHLHDVAPDKIIRMDNPDVTVHVHVIQGSTYIYAKSESGVGGLPVGSGGRFVMMLSSGIDSPVAMWKLIHRGAVAVALHFSGAPQTDDSSEYLVRDICDALEYTGGIRRLCIARIGDYQQQIAEIVPSKLRVIFFRRLMMAVANEVANIEHAKAIATGESLGQVASQTIDNIRAVDEVAKFPVFRPLIGSDKQEIIRIAEQIDTYDLSIQSCADCCTLFLPRNPETHAKMDEIAQYSAMMDFESWAKEICDNLIVEDRRWIKSVRA